MAGKLSYFDTLAKDSTLSDIDRYGMGVDLQYNKQIVKNEVEQRFLKIKQSSATGTLSKLEISENQRRWLVVGIAIQKVIAPMLRDYVEKKLLVIYQQLVSSQHIDKQTSVNPMKKYHGFTLEYGNINSNDSIKSKMSYDYRITSHVDFSKLFLRSFLVKYSAFDEHCDMSALLGIITSIKCPCKSGSSCTCAPFSLPVRQLAFIIRDIRNRWAHCDTADWTVTFLQDSFREMENLVREVKMPDGKQRLKELLDWEASGFAFVSTPMICQDLLETIRKDAHILAEYTLSLDEDLQGQMSAASTLLGRIKKEMDASKCIQEEQTQKVEKHSECLEAMEGSIDTLVKGQEEQERSHQTLSVDVAKIKSDMEYIETERQKLREKINTMESQLQPKLADYCSFGAPIQNHWFTGRISEMKMLFEMYHSSLGNPKLAAISGIAGAGKTNLAVEYASLSQKIYVGGVIWISAESEESVQNSITRLAIEAGTLDKDKFSTTLFKTRHWLQGLSHPWLMIVDNMDQLELGESLTEIIQTGWWKQSKGHILLTTRREVDDIPEEVPVETANCICLHCFTPTESIAFLQKRVKTEDIIGAADLAHELGHLPLALEQACAYIVSKKSVFTNYCKQFKKLRLTLLKKSKAKWPKMPKKEARDRLSVHTTWKLNFDLIKEQSEEEGLGNGPEMFTKVSAYLFPDEIPVILINSGSPRLCDEESASNLDQNANGNVINEVVSVLTRFSLFQVNASSSMLSMHRLVQEVIRHEDEETGDQLRHIQAAIRMLNKAFASCNGPVDVKHGKCRDGNNNLKLWSSLVLSANALESFVTYTKHLQPETFILNRETATIIYQLSLFHSVHLRQHQALELQARKNEILANLPEISDEDKYSTFDITIPVPTKLRDEILNLSMSEIPNEINSHHKGNKENICTGSSNALLPKGAIAENFKSVGNQAFRESRFFLALQMYTRAIKSSSPESVDCKLYTNRALTNIKLNNFTAALEDADQSIRIDPTFWKGYYWRAIVLGKLRKLSRDHSLLASLGEKADICHSEEFLNNTGLAAASMAAMLHPPSQLESDIKLYYPFLVYHTVSSVSQLYSHINKDIEGMTTTLLLKPGDYSNCLLKTEESLNIVGIEPGVVFSGQYLGIIPSLAGNSNRKILIHYENVSFRTTNSVLTKCSLMESSFYSCRFTNGDRACEKFPACDAKEGCREPEECRKKIAIQNDKVLSKLHCRGAGWQMSIGHPGKAGLQVLEESEAIVHHCVFDNCGGGGVLCDGNGSKLTLVDCIIKNNMNMGVEVRNGGSLIARNNKVFSNGFHGMSVYQTSQSCTIQRNVIHNNFGEGLLLYNANYCNIEGNEIFNNDLCGMTMNGGSTNLKNNSIHSNFLWGVKIFHGANVAITQSHMFQNKVGAIYLGPNISGRVYIDENTIHHHTGPDISILPVEPVSQTELAVARVALALFTSPPIITDRNILYDNNIVQIHPNVQPKSLFQRCAYCGNEDASLRNCSSCRKVNYCSRNCQRAHWSRHRVMCKILHGETTVRVSIAGEDLPKFRKAWKNCGSRRQVVKILTPEYRRYNPNCELLLCTRDMHIIYICNETIYNLILECGACETMSASRKKIFVWVELVSSGESLDIRTDVLPLASQEDLDW